ncbi:lipoate--protein ligase family protein, partial [Clostridioides difficile]|nr:lipoate--protein ligase family protein [Clostridioides difficile]
EENALRNTLDSIEINDYFLGADTDILVSGILGVK